MTEVNARPEVPRSSSNSPAARQLHDTPKEVSSKFVNAHNTHSLALPKEVNDRIAAARERAGAALDSAPTANNATSSNPSSTSS